jgi:hypothetical protein
MARNLSYNQTTATAATTTTMYIYPSITTPTASTTTTKTTTAKVDTAKLPDYYGTDKIVTAVPSAIQMLVANERGINLKM